jgi:hypothetical protein
MSCKQMFGCFLALTLAPACGSSSSGGPASSSGSSGSTSSGSAGGGSSSGAAGSGSSSSGSSASGSSGPSRTSTTCPTVLGNLVASQGGSSQPGSWGDLPSALQQIPTGGSLCGALYNATPDGGVGESYGTSLLTTLYGKPLFDFYSPLVTTLGCTLGQPDSGSLMTFNCTGGGFGTIAPDQVVQAVLVTYAGP